MDDLHARFRRLDRVAAPDLWNDALRRSSGPATAPRAALGSSVAVLIAAILLAGLAATLAVGSLVRRLDDVPLPVRSVNGLVVAHDGCGRIRGIDPTTSTTRDLASVDDLCAEDAFGDTDIAWSADGRWMAYLVEPVCLTCPPPSPDAPPIAESGVWIYDARSDERRLVEPCPETSCGGMDLSPDGSMVAYLAFDLDLDPGDLVVSRVDGSDTRTVELGRFPVATAFSPDGRRIAVSLIGGDRPGVYVIELDSLRTPEAAPEFVFGATEVYDVAWSPDGEWLGFYSGSDTTQVGVVRADGSDMRILASGREETRDRPMWLSWAPDSGAVAYVRGELGGTLELFTANIDGSPPERRYSSACCLADVASPAWSPDGEHIAFGVRLEEEEAASGLFVIGLQDGNVDRLGDFMIGPVWQAVPAGD